MTDRDRTEHLGYTRRFTLTGEHLALISRLYIQWSREVNEDGAPEIDPFRPYGNRQVLRDIAEVIERHPPEPDDDDAWDRLLTERADYYRALHRDTATALAIVLATHSFIPGIYEADRYRNDWRQTGDLPTNTPLETSHG
jgi:hypothetical protein